MKSYYLIILAILISAISIAQNGINYKALIKDANDDVVANQSISILFEVVSTGYVYQETHSPTTDANGLLMVNIGEGTVISGNFSSIDWGTDEYFLNVQVDTGAGYVNLGTTPFKQVPYAIYAQEAGNVNGLVTLDEGNGTGYRLANQDPTFYGDIGAYAIDFSTNTSASSNGATGEYSIAGGRGTRAEGSYSVALGFNATASGSDSFALGSFSEASGTRSVAFGGGEASGFASFALGTQSEAIGSLSTAIGIGNEALQDASTALGWYTIAPSTGETAIGLYNTSYSPSAASGFFSASDRVFSVGNGWDGARSNALSVFKNGTVLAESLDIAEIINDKTLITKEYLEAVETKGLEQILEDGNSGFRLTDKNPIYYGNIGNFAVDLSTSFTTSVDHGATGSSSFATGSNTIASSGNTIAGGYESEASGGNATALGYRTKAEAQSSFVIGVYNIGGGVPFNFSQTNPLFEIGNGSNEQSRSNAFTVLQSGNIGIGKHEDIDGKLEIETNSTALHPHLALIENNASFARLKFKNTNRNGDDYWDIAGFIGTTQADDRLNFFNSDGGDIMSIEGDGDVRVNGSIVHSSDRRLKRDVENIDFGISEILKLKPVQYNWKNKEDKPYKSLGVIAQEIEKIIPNVVQIGNDQDQTLSVSYTELVPVLIKAIQEQQAIIDSQNDKFVLLEKQVLALASQIKMNDAKSNVIKVSEAEKE